MADDGGTGEGGKFFVFREINERLLFKCETEYSRGWKTKSNFLNIFPRELVVGR